MQKINKQKGQLLFILLIILIGAFDFALAFSLMVATIFLAFATKSKPETVQEVLMKSAKPTSLTDPRIHLKQHSKIKQELLAKLPQPEKPSHLISEPSLDYIFN